ncbi:hypothetical protein BDZ97DRAFT_1211051 [Flammula alnicola]|nr:hypothetical protein BDZ97DRAFT_1211051 [Flammula alnicola]
MSITELPIELILEIASYLDFEDPAPTQFALTCRHIYGIMMPQILADQAEHVRTLAESTYNITVRLSPYKEEVIASSFGLGIGIEPFGGPYRKVEFCVGHNIKDIRCVRGLITHARQLEHVVLNFSRYSSLRKLAVTLDFCVQRPNLSLTVSGNLPDICHGDYGRGPFDFKVEKIKPQIPLVETQQVFVEPRKAKRGILVRIMYPFLKFLGVFAPNSEINDPMPSSSPTISSETTISAIPRRSTVHLALSHEPQLSSFSIESNTLFLPSFYPLTRDLLNMAPITTLSLAHITLHLFDWAQILPSITMPALTNLSIGVKLSIAFPDLLAFLERHESIRILDLTDNEAIGPVKLPPKPILLQLTSLTGNSEYLLPFIQSQRRGNFSLLRRLFLRTPKRTNLHDPLQSHYQYPGDRPIYDLMIHSQYKSRLSII